MKISVNINEMVKVKLSDKGREIHRKNYEELFKGSSFSHEYREPKTDEEGFSEFQLHEIMNEFGSHIIMGRELPFETEIIFESRF